ncbi:MAG: lipopolysaccharide biosynthesis protein, partial [Stellaceae bacterium]
GIPARVAASLRDARAKLGRRPFLKNVSIMLSGAAAGQFLSVVLSPALTRLYTPQEFGILSVYSAILTITVVAGSLRYELALPLLSSDEDAVNLMAVCGCVLVVMTGMVCAAAFLFPESWLRIIWPTEVHFRRVHLYCALLTLGFLCLGAYYVALYSATRQGAFRAIARTRISQGAVGPLTQIALGLTGFGAPGLVIGSILGQSTGSIGLLWRQIGRNRELLGAVSWQRMRTLSRRYIRFPLIASWAALIDAAGGNQLLFLVVSVEFSPRIAGFIFLAERIAARPLSLIGTSILQVFVGEAGRIVSTDAAKLRRRFYQVTSRQFLIAAVWLIVVNIGAALLFPIVFGASWTDAVIYLQAMSLGYLAQAMVLPVFHTLQILEKQSMAAAWQVGRLTLTVSALGVSAYFQASAPWTIFCYSAAQALACTVLFVLMAGSINRLERAQR